MKGYYLPLGSVVMLKGAKKRLMIAGRLLQDGKSERVYDYCGYLFPEGMQKPNEMCLFNNQDIEAVHFIGAQDPDELRFQQFLVKRAKELEHAREEKDKQEE